MALAAGDRVDRYVLQQRLGEGGQGEVWRVEDPLAPDKPRAVKLVSVASAGLPQLERVRREARQLVQLRHPSLVECFGLFEDLHREVLGIVMEFADGQPLHELASDPRFDDRTRLLMLAHVANALAYIHQRQVVHRDVKLENILVTRGFWSSPDDPATVKLIDFGIAVPAANPKPITQFGHIIGTPPYLAPEQLEPDIWGGKATTSAADVFALGIVAWKLLIPDPAAHPTGLPVDARLDQYALGYRKAGVGTWPPAHPNSKWQSFFERALALKPAHRLGDGLALLNQLSLIAPELVLHTAETTAPTPIRGTDVGDPATIYDPAARPVESLPGSTENVGPHSPQTLKAAVRTIPGEPAPGFGPAGVPAPNVGRAAPSRSRPRSAWPWMVGFAGLAVVGVAALVVAGIAFEHRDELAEAARLSDPNQSPSSPNPDPDRTQPKTPPSQSPISGKSPLDQRAGHTKSSCSDSASLCDCCRAGRDCAGSCEAYLRPGETFDLHVWMVRKEGAVKSGVPMVQRSADVCVVRRRDGFRNCEELGDAFDGRVKSRFLVTTEDLTVHGLDISVNGPTSWGAIEHGTKENARYAAVFRVALCDGLVFDHFSGGTIKSIKFFLDDPTTPSSSRRCARPDVLASPDAAAASSLTATQWGDRCYLHLLDGELGWAKAACDEGMRAGPASPSPKASILYNLAMLEQARNHVVDAKDLYSKSLAIRERPEVREALNSL